MSEPPVDPIDPFVIKDYYLKFSTPEEAFGVLNEEIMRVVYTQDPEDPESVVEIVEGTGEYRQRFLNIDTIGVIYTPTGNTLVDPDGNEYPEMAPIEGHHVNVRVFNSEEPWKDLEPYEVPVETPVRVFGNPIVALTDLPVEPI